MTQIGIIRCEKNEEKCPLTSCFRSMREISEGFQDYESTAPAGVFTCRCPGEVAVQQARILKAKGAEAVHFCTCTFARKGPEGWVLEGGGFCDHIDEIIEKAHAETGIPCVKGTAHLPGGYTVLRWG
ncbi:MAG: CGGC domain-containing protein [Deltaproteobacteria bacterium]|nr:CGGC domain-containing protein [Deltaproteobacteria bacterium]